MAVNHWPAACTVNRHVNSRRLISSRTTAVNTSSYTLLFCRVEVCTRMLNNRKQQRQRRARQQTRSIIKYVYTRIYELYTTVYQTKSHVFPCERSNSGGGDVQFPVQKWKKLNIFFLLFQHRLCLYSARVESTIIPYPYFPDRFTVHTARSFLR